MAVFKCKMCGGALDVSGNATTTTCEYCGSQQTLPRLNDDRMERLYDRANHFRRNNEFDKAMGIYEQILDENNEDAEAYWSIVLCRYGIEYVEDPKTHQRIPTVNRAQITPVSADADYALALKYADVSQKVIYENEAKVIDEILEGIFAFSRQEEAFDVFISYKETDDITGSRTQDSIDALEVFYLPLIKKGYNVFYAPMTLKEKHIPKGKYDSYIFSALSSAKVMIVLGSKEEYFEAEWVKNEWGRYLNRIVKNNEDKDIIPVYRNISPNQLPEKLRSFEAFDLSKPDTLFYVMQKIEHIIPLKSSDSASKQDASPQPKNSHVADNQLYNVRLLSFGSNKLECIKVVRETLGLGLKEAKDLVESRNPILARDVPIHEAENIEYAFSRKGFDVSIEETGRVMPSRANSGANSGNTETLLKRVVLFLEGGDWDNADVYCEKVLDIDPENAMAYIYKLLAQLEISKEEDLPSSDTPLEEMMPYKNALRFADEETAKRLIEYNRMVKENLAMRERERQERAIKEEAERQERIRVEQERRQQEETRRQEINTLQTARNNTANSISSQIKEKERLQGLIAKKQSDAKNATENAHKAKKYAITVLVLGTIILVSFIAYFMSAINSAINMEETDFLIFGAIMFVLILLVCGLLFMIFSAMLLKADGKSVALVLLNFITYGIFSVVIAFIVLGKSKKNKALQYAQEIHALNAQLQQVEAQIDSTRKSLSEINQKLELHK